MVVDVVDVDVDVVLVLFFFERDLSEEALLLEVTPGAPEPRDAGVAANMAPPWVGEGI